MKFNDDIESALILLAYLLNNYRLPWMNSREGSEDFDLKVIERRLSPDSYVKLKLALPAEIRELWTKITSLLPFTEGGSLSNFTLVQPQVYTDLRRVLFELKNQRITVLEED